MGNNHDDTADDLWTPVEKPTQPTLKERECIELWNDGFSQREIAGQLGLVAGAVARAIVKGKAHGLVTRSR